MNAWSPLPARVVKIKSPADVVSLVPWILGFRPGARDLVVIGTVPPRGNHDTLRLRR
jgi:hypothetical protein